MSDDPAPLSRIIPLIPPRPVSLARPPGPHAPILVQARIHLEGRRRFITAGTAAPVLGPGERRLLCIRVEAMPANRRLYLPLQDVLALATEEHPAQEAGEARLRGHA